MGHHAKAAPHLRTGSGDLDGMVGQSTAMQALFVQIEELSSGQLPVLVRGEAGSGKDRVARALHRRSPRKTRRFLAVNSATLSEDRLTRSLETASGGTLLLDDVTTLALSTQRRLVRWLEAGEPAASRTPDVRLVCATRRPLEPEVQDGRLLADLGRLICRVELVLPPLRERPTDLPLLVRHFMDKHGSNLSVSEDALGWLSEQRWPGNVRQLENCLVRATLGVRDGVLGARQLRTLDERLAEATRTPPPPSAGQTTFERAYLQRRSAD
jgi:DNA-binding NtrC family response regulator